MQKEIIFFEFFCGSGTLTKVFRSNGVKCYSFDKRQRKGVCEPDFRVDLSDFKTFEDLLFKCRIAYDLNEFNRKYTAVLFFALPCTSWSIASGGFHFDRDFNPKTKQAEKDLHLLEWLMNFWSSAGKPFFYLENPFGLLRKFEKFRLFCEENKIVEHVVNMGDFGFPSKKPTNIFTNSFIETNAIKVKDSYTGGFNNMTTVQRQAYPVPFCDFIYSDFIDKAHAVGSVPVIPKMSQYPFTKNPPDHSKNYLDRNTKTSKLAR